MFNFHISSLAGVGTVMVNQIEAAENTAWVGDGDVGTCLSF
jgi:hypothetical protein